MHDLLASVYSVTPREVTLTSGEKNQNHTIAFSLELRSLGEVGYTSESRRHRR